MSNRIDQLLTELKERKGIKVPEFAETCGLKPSTIYGIRKKSTMDNVTIDVFLKIAHGLGMTAEELYYGEKQPIAYADEREADIHRIWGELDEERRGRLHNTAQDMELAKSNEDTSFLAQEVAE